MKEKVDHVYCQFNLFMDGNMQRNVNLDNDLIPLTVNDQGRWTLLCDILKEPENLQSLVISLFFALFGSSLCITWITIL